jgi:hypothetical protein
MDYSEFNKHRCINCYEPLHVLERL